MEKLAAVVILYNPLNDVFTNIESYRSKVDCLYVVDNSEEKNANLVAKLKTKKNVVYIDNKGNLGISNALNNVLNQSENKYKYLLTMDQDSFFRQGNIEKYLQRMDLFSDSSVISISPCLNFNGIQEVAVEKWKNVSFCMTSGNIIDIKKSLLIGAFDERLFIDEVDHEFCYRIKKNGYKIIAFYSGIYLAHSLGETNTCGIIVYRQHNYRRVYYIIRNKLIVAKSYPEIRMRYYLSVLKKIFKIIFLEENKIKKMKSVYYGIYDYYNNIYGKKKIDF